ncbi:class II histocompatibility antigen, B-L beta chain-like [Melospiza melodia melodia]|uniref:class II histocompatibility antigen, B-L beta chain-like n=1 Tax=Melospiza melodia melodia TaxID=1914991 RepID=UPI002FD502F3
MVAAALQQGQALQGDGQVKPKPSRHVGLPYLSHDGAQRKRVISTSQGCSWQELSEHVVATDVVPNGDWTYQLLVLLETPPRRGVSNSCQVEHVSLEQPLRRHWEMPPDAARSKLLTGTGGFVLGFVFLALGLGFSLSKKLSPEQDQRSSMVDTAHSGWPQKL